MVLVELTTGERVELAGSDPVARGVIRAVAYPRPLAEGLRALLEGGELRKGPNVVRLA